MVVVRGCICLYNIGKGSGGYVTVVFSDGETCKNCNEGPEGSGERALSDVRNLK